MYAVLGWSGFLGTHMCKILERQGKKYTKIQSRMEGDTLEEELALIKPKYLLNVAGISGRPTVAWCEDNKEETYKINFTLQIRVADICKKLGIINVIFGSGLIFGQDKVYTEEDIGDSHNLYYSQVRILLEETTKKYNNILYLRILYPISGDKNKKCFLSKLIERASTIHDKKVNITTFPLFEKIPQIVESGELGILNFVNKGSISLQKILEIKGVPFSLVSQKIPQPLLDTTKLEKYGIDTVEDSLKTCCQDTNVDQKNLVCS